MSLMTALYSGASGLEVNSLELSVVGDNIANANTIGFKAGRAAFADAMAQQLVGSTASGAGQRGLGVKLQLVQKIMTQGALTNTGLATDLSIEGNGFFVVKGAHNGSQGTYYTRAGQFTIDNTGYLVNLEGLQVQGYTADNSGEINSASVGDLQVGSATAPPRPTDNVTVRGNLAANAAILAAFDPTDAANTSNFSTSVTVYDSLGKAHQIDIAFRKASETAGPPAVNDWEWYSTTDGGNVTGGTLGTAMIVSQGTLQFDDSGRLLDKTQDPLVTFDPIGAAPQEVNFNFGTEYIAGDPQATGLDGLTQFTAASSISFLSQLGYTSGDLSRVSIDSKGRVVGSFSNGQSRVLGQVVLANFEAPDNLMRVGGTLYTEQPASGAATIGAPATADRGGIVAGALEQSNVDLASEFIRMIAAQRGFQANSKTLSTADQLLAELMQIKR